MSRRWLAFLWVLVATGGCCQTMARPDWFSPGTERNQQARARQFDPYPDDNIGPSITGGRPREYQKADPEPERSRWVLGQQNF